MVRVAGRVIWYGLAGLVTGLAVAVLVGIPGGNARAEQSLTDPTRTRASFRGSTDYSMVITAPHATAAEAARLARNAALADRYAPPGEPGAGEANADDGASPHPRRTWVRVTTCGKPFASLWGYWADGGAGTETGGNWLPMVAPRAPTGSRIFPYLPLWRGILGNTAVYGAAWWCVVALARAQRRWRRRRRGACVWCGYDRRGGLPGACPECGWGDGEADGASVVGTGAARRSTIDDVRSV